MDLREVQVSRKEIFEGHILKVVVDTVTLPNGKEATREIALHNGAACVIPVDENGMVTMVSQFRYPFDEVMMEVPAGKFDSIDEVPLEAAKRELKEEVGITAENFQYLGEIRPSVAIFTEVIHMYLATGLTHGEVNPDDDEFLEISTHHIDDLVKMVMDGDITDGKTIACVLKAKNILG